MMQRIFFFFIGVIIGLILGQSSDEKQDVHYAPSSPRPPSPPLPQKRPTQPPAASPASPTTDTLTDIKGIGPSFAKALNDAGILTFAQLAQLTAEEIASKVPRVTVERIEREDWIGQAKSQANRKS